MASTFQFPKKRKTPILETGMMRSAERRTMEVQQGSALVAWWGTQRIGKSTTARWMVRRINSAYQEDAQHPDTFRAVHYEVGMIPRSASRPQKMAIRSLWHATVSSLDEGVYRQETPESLARLLVHELAKRNIELICVDEAGLLSLPAIRGMVLVRDTAKNLGRTLSLVFIGMDDLPQKLDRHPQVSGRVHDWVDFHAHELEETAALLASLGAPFQGLNLEDDDDREVIEWIHQRFEGIPGDIVPFCRRLAPRLKRSGDPLTVENCKVTHQITLRDKKRSLKGARGQWAS